METNTVLSVVAIILAIAVTILNIINAVQIHNLDRLTPANKKALKERLDKLDY